MNFRAQRRVAMAALLAVWAVLASVWYWSSQDAANKRTLTVLAASSLTPAFEALKSGFEAEHPQVRVELVFSGSQVLRMQVQAGAPGDVMASADPRHLAALAQAGYAQLAQPLARNRLAIAVAPGVEVPSWEEIDALDSWIIGSPEVPVGQYTQQLWKGLASHLGPAKIHEIRASVRSFEPNVRLVRSKLQMGQAQAGVVYASDLRGDGTKSSALQEVELPKPLQVQANYAIAQLNSSAQPTLAQDFIAFARSVQGQAYLEGAGLLPREGL